MIITLIWNDEKNEIDMKVNPEQRILDTLLVLADADVLNGTEENQSLYSKRLNEYIEVKMSYEQAGIYNGDILILQ